MSIFSVAQLAPSTLHSRPLTPPSSDAFVARFLPRCYDRSLSAIPAASDCGADNLSTTTSCADRLEAKRRAMREEFFSKLFLLGGWIGATDAYKRTMWTAVPDIALAPACYTLTMRKGLPEPGTDNQLIMAGHEAMLAQWFHRPLARADILLAQEWHTNASATKAFPKELWEAILANQSGEDVRLPVAIWGFPGGQTFLPGVPCIAFEGMGGAISYIEPAMCRYFPCRSFRRPKPAS